MSVDPNKPHETPHARGELDFPLPAPAAPSPKRLVGIGVVSVAVIAGAFVLGYVPLRRERAALAEGARANETARPRVEVIAPAPVTSDRALLLPGSVQALRETTLYARANGYVRKWHADLGEMVKEGQLLAEIDTPELDQELEQARAQLAQAQAALLQSKATRDFSATNLERYKQLAPSGVASVQELDQHQAQAKVDEANVAVSQAAVNAQEANIRRLVQLKSFARVTAPFDGRITQRTVEVGALVTPAAQTPLYRIAALDPARVFVQVPQDVAPSVHPGLAASVTVREYANRAFEGKIVTAAGELEAQSRTMTTVVRVPNPNGDLLPGMYAQVSLTLPAPHRVLELPATALMSDAKGVHVQLVGDDDRVRVVDVVIERDAGPTVDISSGIREGDRVIKIAGPRYADGDLVEVAR